MSGFPMSQLFRYDTALLENKLRDMKAAVARIEKELKGRTGVIQYGYFRGADIALFGSRQKAFDAYYAECKTSLRYSGMSDYDISQEIGYKIFAYYG